MTKQAKEAFELTATVIGNNDSLPLKVREDIIKSLKTTTVYQLCDEKLLTHHECNEEIAYLDRLLLVLPLERINKKPRNIGIFNRKK